MAEELKRAKTVVSEGHTADSMEFIAAARDLAKKLGYSRPEASTFRAIFAVLKRDAYSSDKEAWEAHGAAARTYQQYKSLIDNLDKEAIADGFIGPSIEFAMLAMVIGHECSTTEDTTGDTNGDMSTCNHGHRMARHTGAPPATYWPDAPVCCDVCRIPVGREHFFHCPRCRYDLCPPCAEPHMQRKEIEDSATALAQPHTEGVGAWSTAYAMCASLASSASRRIFGSSAPAFNEYWCTEKIDLTRLGRIVDELRFSQRVRQQAIEGLKMTQEQLTKLERCQSLELVATRLLVTLPKAVDAKGRASVDVRYEERDVAGKGRLFATGQMVNAGDESAPRVLSLQGMQSDLRAVLVGEFAHDVDCENSEFRLIWSLAQMYEHDLPIIESYCKDRQALLTRIVQAHNVDVATAKRLPNIIASGGQYRTWMRKFDVAMEDDQLRVTVNRLHDELRVLHDDLVRHPDFAWLDVERKRMLHMGQREPLNLMPVIVRACERNVLRIVHRCFFDHHWDVRALIFDGLIAEPGALATESLAQVMLHAERQCLREGWEVRLAEKPLHGLHDSPVKTIVDAYHVVHQLHPDLELFAVGEEVHIPGFAAARIEAYVRGGPHDGRVRVRYRDGSTYHVDPKVMGPPGRERGRVIESTGYAVEVTSPTIGDESMLAAPGSGYFFLGIPEYVLEALPPLQGPLVVAPDDARLAKALLLSGSFHTLVTTDDQLGYAPGDCNDACELAKSFYESKGRVCVLATTGIFDSPAKILGPLFGCDWTFYSYTKHELVLTPMGASLLGGRAGDAALEYTKANFLRVPCHEALLKPKDCQIDREALLKPKDCHIEIETPIAIHRTGAHPGQLMWLGFINYGSSTKLNTILSKLLRQREPRTLVIREELAVEALRRRKTGDQVAAQAAATEAERRRQLAALAAASAAALEAERQRKVAAEADRKRQEAAETAAAEAERQKRMADAEAERQQKAAADLDRRRDTRGVECTFSMRSSHATDELQRRSNSLKTATHLTLVGEGFFLARENGNSFWTLLPAALSTRLMRKGLNTQGAVKYVAAGPQGQYFAKVGNEVWWSDACSVTFDEAIKAADICSISRVAFGPRCTWIVLYNDGSSTWDGIPTRLHNKLRSRDPRLSQPVEVALGPNETWFVKFANGRYDYTLSSEVASVVEELNTKGWQLKNVLLNSANGDWLLRYS